MIFISAQALFLAMTCCAIIGSLIGSLIGTTAMLFAISLWRSAGQVDGR